MSTDRPQLNYAPSPPGHPRLMRRLIWLAILAVGVLLGSKFAPRAWNHAQVLYWQGKCLDYSAGAGTVALDSPTADESRPTQTPWGRFAAAWSPPGTKNDRVVFMHELRSPEGERKLVVVTVSSLKGTILLDEEIVAPGNLFKRPRNSPAIVAGNFRLVRGDSQPLKFYAGQPDSGNPSHFTIAFELGGQKGIIDGYLARGDGLQLELRRAGDSTAVAQ